MNRTIFWRLVWKEYRLQRALWIAIVVMTVLLQLIVVWTSGDYRDRTDRANTLFTIALTLAACYALGCGAVLFAAERESGTFEFQRAIPVSSLWLFAAKVAYALASTVTICFVLALAAMFLSGWQLPDAETDLALWAALGLGALEVLAWGIFFSLRSAHPLLAAILAVTVASTLVHFIAWSIAPNDVTIRYQPTVLYRMAVLALVALADLWLGLRWTGARREVSLRERLASWWRLGGTGVSPDAVPTLAAGMSTGNAMPRRPPRGMTFGRLIWQQWRQSRRMMAALGPLALVFAATAGWWRMHAGQWQHLDEGDVAMILASLLAALMGASVFLGDQGRQRFRFFTEHGARPGSVWLTRQLVWLVALLLLITVASLPVALSLNENVSHLVPPHLESVLRSSPPSYAFQQLFPVGVWWVIQCVAMFAVVMLVAYSAGQLCSMFFRSGILAAVFGVMLAAMLCGWAYLMTFLSIPWRWSVTPIPVVLLLATRLRTSDWLLERNRLGGWLRIGLLLAVPAAAIVASVPRVRVSAIPVVPESFASEIALREPTDDERQTEAMFERALFRGRPEADFRPKVEPNAVAGVSPAGGGSPYDRLKPKIEIKPGTGKKPLPAVATKTPTAAKDPPRSVRRHSGLPPLNRWDIAWVKGNAESLALALQATRRPISNDAHRVRWDHGPHGNSLMRLLLTAGDVAQAEGKLDAAMEHYVAALRFSRHMSVYHEARMRPSEWVYIYLREWVAAPGQTAERVATMLRELTKATEPPVSWTLDIQSRYAEIRDLIEGNPTALANANLRPRDAAVIALWNRWLPWERERALRVLDVITYDDLATCVELEDALARGESRYAHSGGQYRSGPYGYDARRPSLTLALDSRLYRAFDPAAPYRELDDMVGEAASRREVRLVLAIEAFKLQHGHMPKTLRELVGPCLKDVPSDPYTGEPFRYFPEGLLVALSRWSFPDEGKSISVDLKAHTPFLWSAGGRVRIGNDREGGFRRYSILDSAYSLFWYNGRWYKPETEQDVLLSGRIYVLP